MGQNHVIDPAYFDDAIAEFAFSYDWYSTSGSKVDDMGRQNYVYSKLKIVGSLQSQGTSLSQGVDLNSEDMQYRFYCKSNYRIMIGDFICYKNRWLRVTGVRDFDEWGVRSATLRMVDLNNYHNFRDQLKYLNGEATI